jgi:hypothetical protein
MTSVPHCTVYFCLTSIILHRLYGDIVSYGS